MSHTIAHLEPCGVKPWDPRTRHLARKLHVLGAAPMLHALIEVASGADLGEVLERYAQLDPAFVRALSGDRFPSPIHALQGGRP